jgi:8-oxo-dGTP pyrophosphatase MutT (NUDIX family)
MAAQEESAGFVVFQQAENRLYLLLDYGHHWDYPKGHLDPGETPMQAALRELKEETGIGDATVIDGFGQEISYFFRDKKKGLVRKKVTFFLARIETDQVKLSREHTGYAFEPFEAAVKKLTFPSAREVLRKAEEFLIKQSNP